MVVYLQLGRSNKTRMPTLQYKYDNATHANLPKKAIYAHKSQRPKKTKTVAATG